MAQATLHAAVVLGGRVDNTFTQIGDALLNMGMVTDEISQKLINFGKESINVYRGYQDSMLDAEVALSTTYGRGTRELKAVMTELEMQASAWAANSIFHTDDVSNAIAEAAHAGWDYEKILSGIPSAMHLAEAGGLDLSQALNYIVKTTNAAGIAFDEMPGFVDKWVYAANSSAATVGTFGDAFLRLGSTMRFAGSEDELLTLLAAMHDMGAEGAEAATLLRNTMIRLIAPTDKAATAMAFLGVSEEEVNAAMAETKGNSKKAAQMLKEVGFSAYDQKGNLKSFLDIFTELGTAVEKLTPEERNEVLASIFPTKTITGALNVLQGLNGELELYNNLISGKAGGYGQYASETMMSGLTGSIELFKSKLEELKRLTGEALEGDVTNFLGIAGEWIDKVSTMDERSFNGLVAGLEGIAIAGPGLTVAGWGFRFLGQALGTHTGRIAIGAAALLAFYKAMDAVAQYDYEQSFGNLTLDSQQIEAYLKGVKQPFIDARKDLDAYKKAMEDAVAAYTDKSSELAQGIITKMVTGTTLTEEEASSFQTMGEEIIKNLRLGINNSYETTNQSLLNTFGGLDAATDDPLFRDINALMQLGYSDATSKAESLSQQLRSAMTSAFSDGKLTGDEVANIQAIMEEMNSLLALQTNAAMYAKEETLMRRAQTLGIEGLEQLRGEVNAAQSKVLDQLLEDQARDMGQTRAYLEFARGREINGRIVDDDFINETISGLRSRQREQESATRAAFSSVLVRAYDNALMTSEFGEIAGFMEDVGAAARRGDANAEAMMEVLQTSKYSPTQSRNKNYARFMDEMISGMGGEEAMKGMIGQWTKSGDTATAGMAQRQLDAWRLYNGDYSSFGGKSSSYNADLQPTTPTWDSLLASARSVVQSLYPGAKKQAEETKEQLDETLNPQEIEVEFPDAVEAAKAAHDAMAAEFPTIYQDVVVSEKSGTKAKDTGNTGGGFLSNLWNGAKSLLGFAEGGRSDEPAIFGEGSTAEWAIPEAHTMRTASLLAAAAEASGFTWPELASAGASSGSGGRSAGDGIVVHYSPVIHSDNAGDLDRVLREDKARLQKTIERILDERQLYESVVSYS